MPREQDRLHGRGTASNPPNRFTPLWHVRDPDWTDAEDPAPTTQFFNDTSRSIITSNSSPDVGFERSLNPYRGCEHGCVYCLAGDTPILMADGSTRPLATLRVGDAIYGTAPCGSSRVYTHTSVLAHWRVDRPAYRLTLTNGTRLVAGGEHRFLTESGWKWVAERGPQGQGRPHLQTHHRLMGPGPCTSLSTVGVVNSNASLGLLSIVPLGSTMPLYDLTTGTGDFIAHGVVSHNCYARPTHEYLGFSAGLDFESKIVVKPEAPDLLRRELASPGWQPQVLAMSGVTECYQPVERRLLLTRRCLEVLVEFRNPVAIVTKNALVTRDIDLLKQLAEHEAVAVFLSVTTLNAPLARVLEPRASQPARRLAAIAALAQAGIPVGVLVAPVIPGLTEHELPAIIGAAAQAGAQSAGYVPLRLPHGVADLFESWLAQHAPTKQAKILQRLRALRGGKLNDPRFGSRMQGEGIFAQQIAALFHLACRKAGLPQRSLALSTAAFRRPAGPQLSLFP